MVASNERGRALEYVVVNAIEKYLVKSKINYRTDSGLFSSNFRDKRYFDELPESDRIDFLKFSEIFISWLHKQKWFDSYKDVLIKRITDDQGKFSNPTDISIQILYTNGKSLTKNFSLKHHHDALKHPRPPAMLERAGVVDEEVILEYRSNYDRVWEKFYLAARKLDKKTILFNELIIADKDFVNKNLYEPLNEIVCEYLGKYANNSRSASIFFKFLTSDLDFYTIKNDGKMVLIKHFSNLTQPNSFEIIYPYNSKTTFLLKFDNGWDMTFRLHTASSEFFRNGKISKQDKFDVICINLEDVIKIEKIQKN